jgi:membrane fusion protein (multidrug efflux system)
VTSLASERVAVDLPGRGRLKVSGRRLLFAGLAGLLGLAAALYGYRWWTEGRFIETTDDAYVGGNVTTLSPQVSGLVTRILVADNQPVRAGQLLIVLDDRDERAALARAEAVVAKEQALLANLRARRALQQSVIAEAAAGLQAAQAAAAFAGEDAARYRVLALSSFASRQEDEKAAAARQKAQAAVRAAAARLAAAREERAVLDTEKAATEAGLAQAEADRRRARLALGYTRIRAPIDGIVGDRSAEAGAYAMAGNALLSIVPARGLWVDANFKEDELARMRPGQKATIVFDTLSGHAFEGRVLSLAPATGAVFSVIPPQNATGNFTRIVQRVPVRIALLDGAAAMGLIRPGLSATVSVDTRPPAGERR